LKREGEVCAVDDGKEEGEHGKQPASRRRGEARHDEREGEKEGQAVIDDIERGKPPGEEPDQGHDRADDEPGLGERFQGKWHALFRSFFGLTDTLRGKRPYMRE